MSAILLTLSILVSCAAAFVRPLHQPRLALALALGAGGAGASAAEPNVEQLKEWTEEFFMESKKAILPGEIVETYWNWFADDFVQTGPDIGPMTLADYAHCWTSYQSAGMDFSVATPDLATSLDGFHLDPHNPWRIWFVVRYAGTQTGPMTLPSSETRLEAQDPPRQIRGGPEMHSLWWTPEKQIRWQTVGYSGDRYTGTNQGYGALMGHLIAMGIPRIAMDVLNPYIKVQTWFSQFGSNSDEFPRTRSPYSELPQWWKDRKNLDMNIRV